MLLRPGSEAARGAASLIGARFCWSSEDTLMMGGPTAGAAAGATADKEEERGGGQDCNRNTNGGSDLREPLLGAKETTSTAEVEEEDKEQQGRGGGLINQTRGGAGGSGSGLLSRQPSSSSSVLVAGSNAAGVMAGVTSSGGPAPPPLTVGPAGSTITFWDIGYEVADRRNRRIRRRLLKDVCGVILPGQVLAIMGPSGCGKTSLLEILGGRNSPTKGCLMANGRLYDDDTKRMVGFVPQEDALFGTLTVAETVLFTAELRIGHGGGGRGRGSSSREDKMERVQRVLEELNLVGVRDSLVGDKVQRGISGGERKRVSIARELVYDPQLLLLDEPTSGLDSFTSIKVMRLLRRLAAQRGRTISASIHQPSTDIFGLFDQLMLLASGRVVYCGPAATAVDYFQELGLECPRYANPADFFLSACCDESIDLPPAHDPMALTPKEVTERLIQAFQVSKIKAETDVMITQARIAGTTVVVGSRRATASPRLHPSSSSWWHQFSCLCRRSSCNTRRNPLSSYVIIGRTLVMALLVGSLYWQIDLGAAGVMDRSGALFFVLTNQVMSSLASLTLLLDEREIVSHESRSALYPVSAYFVAKQLAELPLQVTMSVVLSCITYWMVGFQAEAARFLGYTATLVLASLVAESYILLCGSITTSGKVAMVLAPVLLTLFLLFGGFFINSGSIPIYYQWIKYISFFNYLNVALQKNEFQGLTFAPTVPGQPPLTGDDVIASLHLLPLSVWSCLGVVAAMALLFRVAAFAFVRVNYRPKPFELPPEEQADVDDDDDEEEEDEELGGLLPPPSSSSQPPPSRGQGFYGYDDGMGLYKQPTPSWGQEGESKEERRT